MDFSVNTEAQNSSVTSKSISRQFAALFFVMVSLLIVTGGIGLYVNSFSYFSIPGKT